MSYKIYNKEQRKMADNVTYEIDVDLKEVIPIFHEIRKLGFPITFDAFTELIDNSIKGKIKDNNGNGNLSTNDKYHLGLPQYTLLIYGNNNIVK